MADPLKPSPALLAKLGSVIVHFLEGHADGGHAFDIQAMNSILKDAEVIEWMRSMTALALLPVRRPVQPRDAL